LSENLTTKLRWVVFVAWFLCCSNGISAVPEAGAPGAVRGCARSIRDPVFLLSVFRFPGYSVRMNETVVNDAPLTRPEKLALAQRAFEQFHSRCFWFMRRDAQITEPEIPYICERLRADGGRPGFLLAAQICQ